MKIIIKWLKIGLIVLVMLVIIAIFYVLSRPTSQPTPQKTIIIPTAIPNPQATPVSPLQKVIIGGEANRDALTQLPNAQAEKLSNGAIQYKFPSALLSRKNLIVVDGNNKYAFERIILTGDTSTEEFKKLSDYANIYGQPDKIVDGSNYYSLYFTTYVYASKGFTIIGNLNTNEAYEVQTYSPMSVENYIKYFGEDTPKQ